ncbi:MAG: MFS transporter [Clostridiales bacterium]|nr:MFS transporter [Clostridiales bacterium]
MNDTNTAAKTEKPSKAFCVSWALSYQGGAMLIAATISSYFSVFLTDTVGIPAAAASVMLFIATLWDAINDPIMGTIADRTKSRWGRYRPYFLFFPPLFTAAAMLVFANPDLPMMGKIVYTEVFYIMWGMLYTILTMPWQSILPAHVKDDNTRNGLIQAGGTCMAIAFTIASSFTTNFIALFGGSYVPLMFIYGVFTCIMYWVLFKTSTERYLMPVEKRSVGEDLKRLIKHKELLSVIIVWMMSSLGYGLMFGSSVYYIMYYWARPDLISTYMLAVSVGAIVSMMFLMGILLKIFKGSVVKAFQFSQGVSMVCYIILFFFGKTSLVLLYVLTFIATAFGAMEQAMINILVNDTIDYIMLKDKMSLSATISAIKGFAQKCGSTLSNSGILAVLAITGYVAGAIGEQPDSAMLGINIIRFGLPAATCIVIILCLAIYPISKYYDEIAEMKKTM